MTLPANLNRNALLILKFNNLEIEYRTEKSLKTI